MYKHGVPEIPSLIEAASFADFLDSLGEYKDAELMDEFIIKSASYSGDMVKIAGLWGNIWSRIKGNLKKLFISEYKELYETAKTSQERLANRVEQIKDKYKEAKDHFKNYRFGDWRRIISEMEGLDSRDIMEGFDEKYAKFMGYVVDNFESSKGTSEKSEFEQTSGISKKDQQMQQGLRDTLKNKEKNEHSNAGSGVQISIARDQIIIDRNRWNKWVNGQIIPVDPDNPSIVQYNEEWAKKNERTKGSKKGSLVNSDLRRAMYLYQWEVIDDPSEDYVYLNLIGTMKKEPKAPPRQFKPSAPSSSSVPSVAPVMVEPKPSNVPVTSQETTPVVVEDRGIAPGDFSGLGKPPAAKLEEVDKTLSPSAPLPNTSEALQEKVDKREKAVVPSERPLSARQTALQVAKNRAKNPNVTSLDTSNIPAFSPSSVKTPVPVVEPALSKRTEKPIVPAVVTPEVAPVETLTNEEAGDLLSGEPIEKPTETVTQPVELGEPTEEVTPTIETTPTVSALKKPLNDYTKIWEKLDQGYALPKEDVAFIMKRIDDLTSEDENAIIDEESNILETHNKNKMSGFLKNKPVVPSVVEPAPALPVEPVEPKEEPVQGDKRNRRSKEEIAQKRGLIFTNIKNKPGTYWAFNHEIGKYGPYGLNTKKPPSILEPITDPKKGEELDFLWNKMVEDAEKKAQEEFALTGQEVSPKLKEHIVTSQEHINNSIQDRRFKITALANIIEPYLNK